MKPIIASFVFIASFIGYAVFTNSTSANQAVATNDAQTSPSVSDTVSPAPITTGGSVPPTAPAPVRIVKKPVAATGKYTDGTYTGSVANAYYGNIQVKATVSGGKLTNVTFLQYPNDRSTSRYINQQAMPVLRSEAIQAQSANVDGVSGASDSSAAFKQSLASALARA